ncbi:hypothetical protein FACS1894216_19370 [Synergistales bacterium]|nr:hypothetical protein FACS1894216_19370 [Synergistales bacterium]
MKLRPHHLLCAQGYSGKGYDSDFTVNMTAVTKRLREERAVTVEIVFSTDDICSKCPKMLGQNLCRDDEKVNSFDRKVRNYFGIEEKIYVYDDITREINSAMTEAMMDDICGDCAWYPVSACKKRIIGGG